jgi:hypothetical protein
LSRDFEMEVLYRILFQDEDCGKCTPLSIKNRTLYLILGEMKKLTTYVLIEI